MTEIRSTDTELQWRASALTLALATCAGVALAAALIGARWHLIAFAAPLLGVLCSIRWQRPLPAIRVHAELESLRCFEKEEARIRVRASAADATVPVRLSMSAVGPMRLEIVDEAAGELRAVASAPLWGRYPVAVRVDVVAHGGLLAGTGTVDAIDVFVFPEAPPESTAIPRTELLDRLGTHLTRHHGPGVEYADIRPYVPGDQLRTINWPVSARRGNLHVTERLTDRSADVVVLIDRSMQPPGPATDATERTVRGAAQVVQTALRNGDRAGLVALGDRRPRWLGAEIGRRQFYRVLDTVLAVGDTFKSTTGTLAPRAAVPPGAIVVGFSTMLDTEFALALIDLSKRGHVVVAVDVLQGSPFGDDYDALINRMWSLQRSFMYRDMATIGVDVVSWRSETTLEDSMRMVPDHRRAVRR